MNHFPLRTFMACVTFWTVTTQLMVLDYMKYNARLEVIEDAARAFRPAGTDAGTVRLEHMKL